MLVGVALVALLDGGRKLPAQVEDARRGLPAVRRRGDGRRRHGAVRRTRSADAVGSDDDSEMAPRGLRHRAQQLSRGAGARSGEGALRASRHPRRRRASSSAPTLRPASLPTLAPLAVGIPRVEAGDGRRAGHGGAGERWASTAGARRERRPWGFAGLAKRAEDDKNRAYHDLGVVRERCSTTGAGRGAARPNDPETVGAKARLSAREQAWLRRAGRARGGPGDPAKVPPLRRASCRCFRVPVLAPSPPTFFAPPPDPAPDPGRGASIWPRSPRSCAPRSDAGESVRRRARRRRGPQPQALRDQAILYFFLLRTRRAEIDWQALLRGEAASASSSRWKRGWRSAGRGRLTFYEARGRFQMSRQPTLSRRGPARWRWRSSSSRQRLGAGGLFDRARKRPLLVSAMRQGWGSSPSPQGAVVRDIIRIAHRRFRCRS